MTTERLKEIKTIQHQIVSGEMSVMDFREKGGKALYDCLSLLSEQEVETARIISAERQAGWKIDDEGIRLICAYQAEISEQIMNYKIPEGQSGIPDPPKKKQKGSPPMENNIEKREKCCGNCEYFSQPVMDVGYCHYTTEVLLPEWIRKSIKRGNDIMRKEQGTNCECFSPKHFIPLTEGDQRP